MSELISACKKNDTVAAKKLVNKKNVNDQDKFDNSPLYISSFEGNLELVKLFVKKGADLEAKTNVGDTSLMVACLYKKTEIMGFLIKSGANLNAQNNQGGTALFKATWNSEFANVKLLIDNNAELNIKNNKGETALSSLLKYNLSIGFEDIVKLLIKSGADVDSNDNQGNTALINFCNSDEFSIKRKTEIILYLADKGADFFHENNTGDSAYSILNENNDLPVELKALLEKLTLEKDIDSDDVNSMGL